MPMFIRYDCVISSPLHALIERLDDHQLYDASSGKFVPYAGGGPVPRTMFLPMQPGVPLPNVHAATVDTSDAEEFPSESAYGFYVFNGANRISALQFLSWNGARVVVTIDGRVVYAN